MSFLLRERNVRQLVSCLSLIGESRPQLKGAHTAQRGPFVHNPLAPRLLLLEERSPRRLSPTPGGRPAGAAAGWRTRPAGASLLWGPCLSQPTPINSCLCGKAGGVQSQGGGLYQAARLPGA